jgi:threonine dehydrogenase-like Zn-dependent dehydrogenase
MGRYGVWGEEAIVPAGSLSECPAKLSPVEGAAIWMQYLTASGAIITLGGVKLGDFVLITAASRSVGLAAIQIANSEGATSIATTRKSDKRNELLWLGAVHVIAAEEEDLMKKVNEITGGNGARIISAGPGHRGAGGSGWLWRMTMRCGSPFLKRSRKKGFAVIEAGDGNAAMDLLRANHNEIDLVLLDVIPPGISSREIFEEAQGCNKQKKVILAPTASKRSRPRSVLRADRFIRKPFPLDDFIGLLQDALAS